MSDRPYLRLLAAASFAERYYAYCAAHTTEGPDLPLSRQTSALAATGRTFRYHKREGFFAWRDGDAPKGCELGVNLDLRHAQAEWILVYKTPRGHIGGPFALLARLTQQLSIPGYEHEPRSPRPDIASASELRAVIDEGLVLYDEVAKRIAGKRTAT